jgi:uncharacterized repeat protein (TIGR03803 family)
VYCTLFVICLLATQSSPALARNREKVLFNFNEHNGWYSASVPIIDAAGNLYATTGIGGKSSNCGIAGCGLAFKLTPTSTGGWKQTVLHQFDGADGFGPNSLISDASGSLYGTSTGGGANGCFPFPGCGNVFKLTPGANGKWTQTVLHVFKGPDGGVPESGLTFDTAGNLYGTTQVGGASGHGTVFKLAPGKNGKWTYTVLHAFNGLDGAFPYSAVVFDTSGNLYGTTFGGGQYGLGTVFQLSPGAHGKWTETVLHSFRGKDGQYLYGAVIVNTAGRLFGTAYSGGDFGSGVVFELTPSGGNWTQTVLLSFSVGGTNPYAGLVMDAKGDLYGTLAYGDNQTCPGGCGSVFKLTKGSNGTWRKTILHAFDGNDGGNLYGGLALSQAGELFGGTISGGRSHNCGVVGCGVVYEITP